MKTPTKLLLLEYARLRRGQWTESGAFRRAVGGNTTINTVRQKLNELVAEGILEMSTDKVKTTWGNSYHAGGATKHLFRLKEVGDAAPQE